MCSSRKSIRWTKKTTLQVDGSFAYANTVERGFRCGDCVHVDDELISEVRDQRYPGRLFGASIETHILHCAKEGGGWMGHDDIGCRDGYLHSWTLARTPELILR